MIDNVECKIEYNNAVEFIASLLKYANYKARQVEWNIPELNKDIAKDLMVFTPNVRVKEWLEYVDTHISPFFRNDVVFITLERHRLIDICFHLVLMEDIDTPLELIDALKALDTKTMIEIAYKFYELDAPLDDDEKLRDAITQNFSKQIASSFLEIKNAPEEFKEKSVAVLNDFYHQFYKPYEEEVYAYMEDRIVFHQELFEKDPIYFINTLGIGDYSKAIAMHNKIMIYLSFFIDVGIFYFTHEDTLAMYCGQTVEHRFESRKKRDTYKALFKALSDDKRIEILKLTAQRPWYNKELADYFHLSTATLSYHLNLLLELEILNYEPSIVNNRYYYTTNKEKISELFEYALKDIVE